MHEVEDVRREIYPVGHMYTMIGGVVCRIIIQQRKEVEKDKGETRERDLSDLGSISAIRTREVKTSLRYLERQT